MGLSPDFNEKGRGSVPFPISNPVFADYTVTGMIFLRGFTVLPHLQTIEAGSAGDSDGIETACNAGDLGSIPRLWKIPRREWLPISASLPGEFHGQRSLANYSPWGRRESDATE